MRASLKMIPYIIIQLAVSFLVGLNELFSAGWSWDTFTSARFWFDYITITVATMMSFFSWANFRIMKFMGTPYYKGMEYNPDTDLADLGNQVAIKKNAINSLVQEHRKSDLIDCLKELNLTEKESRYIYKKTNKLYKLRGSWKCEFKLTKKWYAKRIAKLEAVLDETFIRNNISKLKVKYVPITESYVASGVSAKTSTTFRQRQESKTEKMIKDNISKWIITLSYMLLLSSIIFDAADKFTFETFLTIGIKVINCVFQAVMGVNYASTYINEKVISELDDRISIMEYYIEWRNKKKGAVNNG